MHYDSDKSIGGRAFAMEAIAPKLAPGAAVVMDDIDDNTYFRDWAARPGRRARVFARGGKFVGPHRNLHWAKSGESGPESSTTARRRCAALAAPRAGRSGAGNPARTVDIRTPAA